MQDSLNLKRMRNPMFFFVKKAEMGFDRLRKPKRYLIFLGRCAMVRGGDASNDMTHGVKFPSCWNIRGKPLCD